MWNIETLAELPSTQSLARERFYLGTGKHGDVFIALHQTGGKGRFENRKWHDEPGASLLLSIILTEIPRHLQNKMQFVTALSVLATIRNLLSLELTGFAPERVQLKWINDILIDGRKVSGVLTEGIWSGDSLKGMIIGIGININQDSFSEEIVDRAIALKHILGLSLPIERARDHLLATLQYNLSHYASAEVLMNDLARELEWMRTLKTLSLVSANGTKTDGLRYDGITDDGAIRVISSDGDIRSYQNATLTFT
jgi:BirA family biotin operon repressor/biotin-[acetyl-CoA-carboxylase] ligase